MKSYDTILFDLDGTLTDPGVGITNSVAYALEKYHIQVEDRKKLYRFIGPPLHESFEKYYGFSKEEAKMAVEYYREYFKEKGMFENIVYEGIPELLRDLKDRGKRLIVATSKPEVFAKQILEHFDLKEYFVYIAGANMDGTRTRKDEVIRYALESCELSPASGIVMVGDREHDIMGANKAGLDSIGVLFGYGSRRELTAAGATYIAESVDNLSQILLTGKSLSEMSLEELWQLFPIFLTEHQKCWKDWYEEELKLLQHILPLEKVVRISHVGSTAVETIWAKPIVDILVEIKKEYTLEDIKEVLCQNGWGCTNQSENRMSFQKGYTECGFAEKVYHLHLRYAGDNRELYFRDYLMENPALAKKYERLKLELWKKYEHDRDGYTEAKTDFIERNTEKAMKEYGGRYC